MNTDLKNLKPYPFERLRTLLAKADPGKHTDNKIIRWSIGEPGGAPPQFVLEELARNLDRIGNYPTTLGIVELREAICNWLCRRFSIDDKLLDPAKNVIPVSGTRESLFSIAQAVVENKNKPYVISPNPFYQIYEGACLLSGGTPFFVNLKEENGFLPDFSEVPESIWQKTSLVYVCSPSNPTGACMKQSDWEKLLALSDKYSFVIAADECYSEIYRDNENPPVGLLEAAARAGREDFKNCLIFHSLSKRSNLPGMRSGFVAGDKVLLEQYLLYRTYHGCTLPEPIQKASALAWSDEEHVQANREYYRKNFRTVKSIVDPNGELGLGLDQPDGAFYLWFKTPVDDEKFAFELYEKEHLHVLPGSYLSRQVDDYNPGAFRIRMALVAPPDECEDGAMRLKRVIEKFAN